MGKLYKRGDTWWADYRTAANERVRVSLRTADREVARTRLRDAELGIGPGGPNEAPTCQLGPAIDEMIAMKRAETASSYQDHSIGLLAHFGADRDINTITRVDVVGYIAVRTNKGLSRHTIHKELVVLRQTLKEARARGNFTGTLDVIPAYKAQYEPRRRWLTPEEFQRLLAAVPEERRTWLMIQVYTGAELAAMQRLTWAHVDLDHGTIDVPGTKNAARYRGRVPLHGALATHLAKLDKTQPLLQPWPRVHRDLRRACIGAKLGRVSTHDLRRTFGSWLVQAGVDILHVAKLMGNSPAMVARVYGQTSDASYAKAINALPALAGAPKKLSHRRHKGP
jgi:integrase